MRKYIMITGGQLFNKGAQAMTFITVDEMAKRCPEKEVVLISDMDTRRSEEEKKLYKFHIMGCPKTYQLLMMRYKAGRLFLRLLGDRNAICFEKLMNRTAAIVDVSGYALGSNWGYKKTIFYLARLGVAEAAHVPVYLMPQSFGPFEYKGFLAPAVQRMIRKRLAYPQIVFCREQEGYDLLTHKYGLKNVMKAPDLVLQNHGVDESCIYRDKPSRELPDIPGHSVAVIPNKKTIQYGNPERIFALYHQLVKELLQWQKQVFLIYHSSEDLEICRAIKEKFFRNCKDVKIVEQELSCLEFDAVVQKFDFVIASRFHAVVHAYRNGVPAVVLGWATKYQELLAMFSQARFQFDVREQPDVAAVLAVVREMCADYGRLSMDIRECLREIQKDNVYSNVMLRME